VASLVLAVALALAACGGDDDDREEGAETGTAPTATEEATAPAAKPVQTVRVSETNFKLTPANPKIDEPGVVEFVAKNDGSVPHALEVEGPEGEVETENIQPGRSARLKADLSEPGSYVWYCPVGNHRQLGMEGRVTVAGGAGAGGGAAAPEEQGGGGGDGY
jgi:plastocyanin